MAKLLRKYHMIPYDEGGSIEAAKLFMDKILNDPNLDDTAKVRFFQDLLYKIRQHIDLPIVNTDVLDIIRKNFEYHSPNPPPPSPSPSPPPSPPPKKEMKPSKQEPKPPKQEPKQEPKPPKQEPKPPKQEPPKQEPKPEQIQEDELMEGLLQAETMGAPVKSVGRTRNKKKKDKKKAKLAELKKKVKDEEEVMETKPEPIGAPVKSIGKTRNQEKKAKKKAKLATQRSRIKKEEEDFDEGVTPVYTQPINAYSPFYGPPEVEPKTKRKMDSDEGPSSKEIKREIKQEVKKEPKREIKKEIKKEPKREIKREIKQEIEEKPIKKEIIRREPIKQETRDTRQLQQETFRRALKKRSQKSFVPVEEKKPKGVYGDYVKTPYKKPKGEGKKRRTTGRGGVAPVGSRLYCRLWKL